MRQQKDMMNALEKKKKSIVQGLAWPHGCMYMRGTVDINCPHPLPINIYYLLSAYADADKVSKSHYPHIYADADSDFKVCGCSY